MLLICYTQTNKVATSNFSSTREGESGRYSCDTATQPALCIKTFRERERDTYQFVPVLLSSSGPKWLSPIHRHATITLLMAYYFILILILILSAAAAATNGLEQEEAAAQLVTPHTHHLALQLTSLFPSSLCSPTPTSTQVIAKEGKTSLRLVHKDGPCSQLRRENVKVPTQEEILQHDQTRVNSIHSKLRKQNKLSVADDVKATKSANLPAKDGSSIGSGNYFVTVGLGTPKKELSLIFDTGSDLTWTQCEPCVRSCYNQKDPIFDPSASRSYSNISCTSSLCNSLASATGNNPGCSASNCLYAIQYGDSSYSVGFFGKETLTLTATDVFDGFYFGCGQNNRGLFGGAAGLLGLGRDALSFPLQSAGKYNKVFSYCLPSSASSTGHLTFGGANSNAVKYTPFSTVSQGTSFYGIDITGISVGGQKLPVQASVFNGGGGIIDSGTVITRLPPTAYSALKSAFQQRMSKYPKAPALSILDTCYDFSKYSSVAIPKISIFFSGGTEVPVAATGILYGNSVSQVCLAFAPNGDDSDVLILGNTQQKTLEVVYDGAGGKLGFAPAGCS